MAVHLQGLDHVRLGTKTAIACACAGAWSLSGPLLAADFEVNGDVVAQGYEVASPWGDAVVGKRRLTTTLGLAAYGLEGAHGSVTTEDASDTGSLVALANAVHDAYLAHLDDAKLQIEKPNAKRASDLKTAVALLNALKAHYNGHRSTASYEPGVRPRSTVATADARDMATAIALANELKRELNAHVAATARRDAVSPSGTYAVLMRMRVDADFGIDAAERSFDATDRSRFVPGVYDTPVDLMYGYIEGRRIGGWFNFRAGRQYITDALGWWSFDGAQLQATVTPIYLQLEAYGGLEQRGGLPLSSHRYEQQGVWRGSHRGYRDHASEYPSYQFAGQAPAVGAALETAGLSFLHVRWTWRRVYGMGPAFTGQFPAPGGGGFNTVDGLRLSSDRFGMGTTAFLSEVGALRGGFVYDLYSQLASRGYGGLELYPVPNKLVLGVDAEYFRPTFDADSIWNWFTHNPVTTVQGRIAGRPVEGLELSGSGGVRLWMTDGDPDGWAAAECLAVDPANVDRCIALGTEPSAGSDETFARSPDNRDPKLAPDVLADVGLGYRWSTGNVGVNGSIQNGVGGDATHRGRRGGGFVQAQQALVNDVLYFGGQVSAYTWADPLRTNRDATSFGYMLAPEYQPHDATRLRFEWEHNMNRLVGQRFRVLGLVSFRVAP